MTVREILKELDSKKPITREHLYNYLRALKIKPLGKVRQIPVQYPDDTPKRILLRLGFKPKAVAKRRVERRVAA